MVDSNMDTRISTSEQKPLLSRLALLLSVLCCLGFVHVEIKLLSQEEAIKSLARDAMSPVQNLHGIQLATRQHEDFAKFGSWWSFASDDHNKALTSEDESETEDENRNTSNKTTVNTNNGK